MTRWQILFRSLQGPLLMICFGALFAWQQSGGRPIWETWPVLLIVLGLLKLIEYLARPRASAGGEA